jgi:hypothetical protein
MFSRRLTLELSQIVQVNKDSFRRKYNLYANDNIVYVAEKIAEI